MFLRLERRRASDKQHDRTKKTRNRKSQKAIQSIGQTPKRLINGPTSTPGCDSDMKMKTGGLDGSLFKEPLIACLTAPDLHLCPFPTLAKGWRFTAWTV